MWGIANCKIEGENRETNKSLVRCVLISQELQTINQNRYFPFLMEAFKNAHGYEIERGRGSS